MTALSAGSLPEYITRQNLTSKVDEATRYITGIYSNIPPEELQIFSGMQIEFTDVFNKAVKTEVRREYETLLRGKDSFSLSEDERGSLFERVSFRASTMDAKSQYGSPSNPRLNREMNLVMRLKGKCAYKVDLAVPSMVVSEADVARAKAAEAALLKELDDEAAASKVKSKSKPKSKSSPKQTKEKQTGTVVAQTMPAAVEVHVPAKAPTKLERAAAKAAAKHAEATEAAAAKAKARVAAKAEVKSQVLKLVTQLEEKQLGCELMPHSNPDFLTRKLLKAGIFDKLEMSEAKSLDGSRFAAFFDDSERPCEATSPCA
jgi:hypothetical protein